MVKIIKVNAKEIYTKTKIPGLDYVINHYVGCIYGCAYCCAKFMCKWNAKEYGDWGEWVKVKINAPELVKKFVDGRIGMCSVSDPYQPIERELELTRKILKNLDKRTNLSILTKSDLVLRDIDILKKFKDLEVGMTINTFNGNVKELFEPKTPSNNSRLDALKILHENKIKTYGFISPVIPELIDFDSLIANSRDFVDYYVIGVLDLNTAGDKFKEMLKERFFESYEIMIDKERYEKFIKDIREILIKKGVKVSHFATYPKSKNLEWSS